MTNETTASQPKSIGDDALWARTEDIRLLFANPTSIPRSTLLHYAECLLAHLAILRAPAAQASTTIQAAPDKFHWCPECGSEESEPTGYDNGKYCSDCGQEWFPDIDYTHVIRKHLAEWKKRSPAATIQEPVMVAEPDNMGIECHYYDIGPARKAFYQGVRAVGARLEAIAKGWDGCNAHGIASGKGSDIGADLRKSFASIGTAPMVADPAGVAGFAELRTGLKKLNRTVDCEHLIHQLDALAATVKAVPSEALDAKRDKYGTCLTCYDFGEVPGGACPDCKDDHCAAPLADKTGGGE